MDALNLLKVHTGKDTKAYHILRTHSECVRDKALEIVSAFPDADREFIKESALLHDIGSIFCDAPDIGCSGREPYIRHGILGGSLLRKLGFPRHARVCERHIGAGLTKENIINQKLPLPERDMLPTTVEEKAICFADCFFSKNPDALTKERTLNEARAKIAHFGDAAKRFDDLARLFNLSYQ